MNHFILSFLVTILITQCQSKNKSLSTHNNLFTNSDTKEIVNKTVSTDFAKKNKCEYISMNFPSKINSDSLSKSIPIKLKITNSSDKTIIAGDNFTLYRKNKNSIFEKVSLTGIIADVGYKIEPQKEIIIEMETFLIKNITTGKYKISKKIILLPEKKEMFLTSEFEVSK